MNDPRGAEPVLLVSIDGLAPRSINRQTMPVLTALADQGASCFSARSVSPTITLPAHASMVRGVSVATHGTVDNTPVPPATEAPSVLSVGRAAGRRTALFLNWLPLDCLFEPKAVEQRVALDAGYGPDDDPRLVDLAVPTLRSDSHDLVFFYFSQPDAEGHAHGWDTPEYEAMVTRTDELLGHLIEAVGPKASILVTTDHGGHDRVHGTDLPDDLETFVVVRHLDVDAGTIWESASILDIAPTVATMGGFDPSPHWEGRSLIG